MHRHIAVTLVVVILVCASSFAQDKDKADAAAHRRGVASADHSRPTSFPHRIWAACDFEGQTPDYAWFGPAEKKMLPEYAGNFTALGVDAKNRPYQNFAGVMTGINPVPGPMMGKVNKLCLRYYLKGATEATFQHFSLSTEDNNHIRVTGLTEGKWMDLTLNFHRDGQRNDGTPGVPFKEGERMDDLKVFVGKPKDGKNYELYIDDVIFFTEEPGGGSQETGVRSQEPQATQPASGPATQPPDKEPFPNRVIFLAAFDTGIDAKSKEKYWPGDFEVVTKTKGAPEGAFWGAAKSVARKDGKGQWIRLQIKPDRPVGRHTKVRFRYHLTHASAMTVQIFDATDQDNRHVRLRNLKQGEWAWQYVDFTTDGRRNDGSNTPFAAGHLVDDLFFFVDGEEGKQPVLHVDEVTLFDAGQAGK